MDLTQLQEYVTLALAVIATTGVVAAALTALVKTVLGVWQVTVSAEAANLIAAALSGGMALPALLQAGAPWPLAVVAVVVALFAPKVAYDAATVAGKRKEALKATADQGR
jgi:hypothetical protein